jgi:hypothetical protein
MLKYVIWHDAEYAETAANRRPTKRCESLAEQGGLQNLKISICVTTSLPQKSGVLMSEPKAGLAKHDRPERFMRVAPLL